MYGRHIGQLNVYISTKISGSDIHSLVWSRNANVGNFWRKAHIPTEYILPFGVIFEGVVGNGFEVSQKYSQVVFSIRSS